MRARGDRRAYSDAQRVHHCTRAASALLSPMRAAIQLWNPNRAALGGRAHASLTQTQPIDRSEPHGVLATPALAERARTLRASLVFGRN